MTRPLAIAVLLLLGTGLAAAEPTLVQKDVNLRAGPGTNFTVLFLVPGGSTADVIGCNAGWCQVSVRGRAGYMIENALALDEIAPGVPPAAAVPPGAIYEEEAEPPVVYGPAPGVVPGPFYGPRYGAPPLYGPGPAYGPPLHARPDWRDHRGPSRQLGPQHNPNAGVPRQVNPAPGAPRAPAGPQVVAPQPKGPPTKGAPKGAPQQGVPQQGVPQ